MKLSKLTAGIQVKRRWVPLEVEETEAKDNDPDITSIHYQSKNVMPGGVFIAIPGHRVDGHDFIDEALARGAAAIVAERKVNKNAIVIEVENAREALAGIAGNFYDHPSLKLCMIGVTGTNGKTTTTYIIENILKKSGFNVGVIGTINYRYSGKTFENPMTTPESLELQHILSKMAEDGVTHVIMEVSSHAIDLCRIVNCWFDVGVFTNLTQDHLDFHKNMKAYWTCKKRFFTDILAAGPKRENATAVINCDDAKGHSLYRSYSGNKLSVGSSKEVMVGIRRSHNGLEGISGMISTPYGDIHFNSALVGGYNLENILCAVGSGIALNLSLKEIKKGIEETAYIPGRLESVPNPFHKFIYVDYAHTPDALENVLNTLYDLKTEKMFCVFGCGGDRDKEKRSQMGEIAGRLCDVTVVTTDNPRSEDPMDIIRQIEEGVRKTAPHYYAFSELKSGGQKKGYTIESDRKKAIQMAIWVAGQGDIVLIAGKGHETYQIIGDKTISFDDKEIARKALENPMTERTS